ncbi:hypothetical protein [Sphingobacterium zeae]|uniref:hypothetical protein n=1 Tax=Sphingobacterium zeae TaxID=1776859 RepID=UPI003618AE82
MREIELPNTLGGTGGGGGSFNDIWNKLANGDLTDIPSGRYDFNTRTFTPMDSSMSNSAWHIVIPTVDVYSNGHHNSYSGYGFRGNGDSNSGFPGSGTNEGNQPTNYNGSGSGSYNYNGQNPQQGYSGYTASDPTQGMFLIQKEIYQYIQNNQDGSGLDLEGFFMSKFNTSGGGTTLYNPNNTSQGGSYLENNPANSVDGDGIYYIVSSKDTQSLQSLNYQTGQFGGYNTELEQFQFLNEHYGDNNRAILTYLLEGRLASELNINIQSVLRDSNDYKFEIDRSKLIDDLVAVTKFLAQFKSVLSSLVPLLGQLSDEKDINIAGSMAGFLDSNFEKELFDIWWHGKAENGSYVMSESDFNELKTLKPTLGASEMTDKNMVKSSDGTVFYTFDFGTYESSTTNQDIINKYKGGLGSFTGIYDSTGKMVGMYDYYNFDNGTRSFGSEFVTRLIDEMVPPDAANFDITYGNIPFEIFDQLKAPR